MKEQAKNIIQSIQRLYEQVEKHEQQNEQWLLEFCDKLNELSIKY